MHLGQTYWLTVHSSLTLEVKSFQTISTATSCWLTPMPPICIEFCSSQSSHIVRQKLFESTIVVLFCIEDSCIIIILPHYRMTNDKWLKECYIGTHGFCYRMTCNGLIFVYIKLAVSNFSVNNVTTCDETIWWIAIFTGLHIHNWHRIKCWRMLLHDSAISVIFRGFSNIDSRLSFSSRVP